MKKTNPHSGMRQMALSWDEDGLTAGVDEAGRGPLAGPVGLSSHAEAAAIARARPRIFLMTSSRVVRLQD